MFRIYKPTLQLSIGMDMEGDIGALEYVTPVIKSSFIADLRFNYIHYMIFLFWRPILVFDSFGEKGADFNPR